MVVNKNLSQVDTQTGPDDPRVIQKGPSRSLKTFKMGFNNPTCFIV